ncbi:MAG: hydrolase 76 protein [Claussenomyces sp. TS43310]|nr:MAG: hydrolase 76 protein [Claussenomyces sp. TS43310]
MIRLDILAAILGLMFHATVALEIDFTSPASIKNVASDVAYGMMTYYKGNESGQIPGNLPPPYYWWECGAMFGTLIDYWYYTGDTTYNDIVLQGMLHQTGSDDDFMPTNATSSMGNDDQAFWAMAAMTAAETNFQNPSQDEPQWLALTQAVFNEQAGRWDTNTCGGGLHWQVYTFLSGYHLKNSISNGCFFNIAARLARYTGNETYALWANKIWDWTRSINLMDDLYDVYDNSDENLNCTQLGRIQWSYNAGTYLLGAATMFNHTNGSAIWQERTQGVLNRTSSIFFTDGVMTEQACERINTCNVDQHSFKAYLARWMAQTTQLAPFTYDTISALLHSSAVAAAAQCTGGSSGQACGTKWIDNGTWDGTNGVGQQMSALEAILGTLIKNTQTPLTNSTGGTSSGNPDAGSGAGTQSQPETNSPVKQADKAGAGILTTLVLSGWLAGLWFMLTTKWDEVRDTTTMSEKGKGERTDRTRRWHKWSRRFRDCDQ